MFKFGEKLEKSVQLVLTTFQNLCLLSFHHYLVCINFVLYNLTFRLSQLKIV